MQRPTAGVELGGHLFSHIEAADLHTGRAQNRSVERIDGSLAIELRETASLKGPVAIAEEHHRPIGPAGVLFVSIVARVDDQGVVHHRAASFGNALQLLHQLHQHAAVVLADFNPDWIVWLLHVAEVMALLLDAQSFPCTKNLTVIQVLSNRHRGGKTPTVGAQKGFAIQWNNCRADEYVQGPYPEFYLT